MEHSALVLERHRDRCQASELFAEEDNNTKHGQGFRVVIPPGVGRGWAETRRVGDGLFLGRADYQLDRPISEAHGARDATVGFLLLLSGQVSFSSSQSRSVGTLRGGNVWFRGTHPAPIRWEQPAHQRLRGICIDLPMPMIHALREERPGGASRTFNEMLDGRRPHFVDAAISREVALVGQRLLAASNETVVGRLELESLTIDLLARVLGPLTRTHALTPPAKPCRRRQAAFDEAVDILQREYAQAHTIASLSRRVGLNECYLKVAFREYAGTTVGNYLRTLRMQHARDLIESGNHTIGQVALFVGYSNPGHFGAAFRKVFGILPSEVL